MAPKKKQQPQPDDGGGLSAREKMEAVHAATSRMIDLLADDQPVQRLATKHPDEIVRVFMAGCQAGADAALRVLDVKLEEAGS